MILDSSVFKVWADLIRDNCHTGDVETDHSRADSILGSALRQLGGEELWKEWEKVKKWYS